MDVLIALRRGLLRAFALCGMAGFAFAQASAARAAEPALESQVKAAYVYKLLSFVRWEGAQPDAEAEALRVCAATGDTLSDALDALAGRSVGQRNIEVRRVRRADALDGCRVVVMDDAVNPDAGEIDALAGRRVLTIGDRPDFALKGGMIGFVRVGDTVRFEVNLSATRRAGLAIDSRALRLATAVHGREAGQGDGR